MIKTPKGLFLARKILACGLTQAQSLIHSHQIEWKVLNALVDQLRMKDPVFTQFFPTFFAWQGLTQALCTGTSEKWNIARSVFQTAAKTLSLLDYFDKLGAHTFDTLLEGDAAWGGLAARLGKSSLFCICGIQTVSGLKNRLSILASLCAIAQAIKDYKERSASDASNPKTVYAKQIFVIQLSKELLKITAAVCVAGTPFATCVGIALLVVNVSKEIFNIYYIGMRARPPREIPIPRCLIYFQE